MQLPVSQSRPDGRPRVRRPSGKVRDRGPSGPWHHSPGHALAPAGAVIKGPLARGALLVFVALLTVIATGQHVHAWEPHVTKAASWAEQRHGEVSFEVRTSSGAWSRQPLRTAPIASVLKPMLMVAYLRRPSVATRPLRRHDLRLLAPMIRRSDNLTATRIRDLVGNGALVRLARRARMRCFRPAAVWGLSRTCAADQARFMLRIEQLVPRRHRRLAFGLLSSIVPSQRWGIARVRPRGWALYFKGGWGSGSGAVDHQVALLSRGRRRVAVAILTTNSPSHDYGKETLRGVAARLLAGL